MPDLLLEFLSEEIPARMQARAADDLRKMVTDRLVAAGLTYEGAKAFATPRRLTLSVIGVPAKQPDIREEKKGPRFTASSPAVHGFLKSVGIPPQGFSHFDTLNPGESASLPDKGLMIEVRGAGDQSVFFATTERLGLPAIDVIRKIIPDVARNFPWPKSMRWGATAAETTFSSAFDSGAFQTQLRWVRPLHSIVATFGPETEEPEIVKFEVGGIKSGDLTRGHRFMAPGPIKVRHFDDYAAKLLAAKVMLDPARRAETILADAKNLAFAQGYELVEDDGLLAEVAGLVEWPVTLMGAFDAAFLTIPAEVIRATIRNNQKCFVLRDPQTAKLANKFVLVANEEASDGGKAIVAGNERVIRARLSDAKFFYETDLKTKLEDRLPKFEQIVFHEKLGTQAERIARITALAKELAPLVKADPKKAMRAAQLCKADLLTEVVGEFPEMQGVMGRYLAEAQGEDEAVAHACEDHYKPKGPDDLVPSDPVSIAVALADKLDLLIGFFAIDERPTGSGDPYALRRAALGILRIVLENEIRLPFVNFTTRLIGTILDRIAPFSGDPSEYEELFRLAPSESLAKEIRSRVAIFEKAHERFGAARSLFKYFDVIFFLADRLKYYLRGRGARHDLVDAVFSFGGLYEDDFLMIARRIEALGNFLSSEDGKNLLAGYKRATNIVRIEEKKDNHIYIEQVSISSLIESEEIALAHAVVHANIAATKAIASGDFVSAMREMAKLRQPVDAFFEKVTVNVADRDLRANRLRLLNQIRVATSAVADFSKIEG